MHSLFFFYFVCILFLPPDWATLKRTINEYERKHIHPVWQAQHIRLYKQMPPKEREELSSLRANYVQQQRALSQWQATPTLLETRNQILKKMQQIRTALIPIQEKYNNLLETFANERNKLKTKWQTDIQQLIAQYNAQIDNETRPFFAKERVGMYDDEDEFLLWLSEAESAAGARED